MKNLSIQLIKAFLMRQGIATFTPDSPCGFDLLALFDNSYCRIICATVSDPKPIVSLKSTRSGVSVTRSFDLLYCVHTNSLTIWRFPYEDVPDKESIYLGKRYSAYQIPFLGVKPDKISLPEVPTYEDTREHLKTMLADIEQSSQIEESTYDEVKELLE